MKWQWLARWSPDHPGIVEVGGWLETKVREALQARCGACGRGVGDEARDGECVDCSH